LRIPFPRELAVLIVIPKVSYRVPELSEPDVKSKTLLSSERTDRFSCKLARYALSYIIRGLVNSDYTLFGKGVNMLQDLIGDFFSSIQGGRYATHQTERAVEILRDLGALGSGQSSWGPLAYGFFKINRAATILRKLRKLLDAENIEASLLITRANNRGARLLVS